MCKNYGIFLGSLNCSLTKSARLSGQGGGCAIFRTLPTGDRVSSGSLRSALLLRKALMDRCSEAGFQPEWQDVRLDLDRLQEVVVDRDGKQLIIRTPTTGVAGKLFQAIGNGLPPNLREITAET